MAPFPVTVRYRFAEGDESRECCFYACSSTARRRRCCAGCGRRTASPRGSRSSMCGGRTPAGGRSRPARPKGRDPRLAGPPGRIGTGAPAPAGRVENPTGVACSGREPPTNDAEAAALFRGMPACTGPFTVAGDKVITEVDAAWHPAWEHSRQPRVYDSEGNRLTLKNRDAGPPIRSRSTASGDRRLDAHPATQVDHRIREPSTSIARLAGGRRYIGSTVRMLAGAGPQEVEW